MTKVAIVVLTRGYNEIKDYKQLISRNRHIAMNFYLKLNNKEDYDIIIFHEGNIHVQHQNYIQSNSPRLPLIFKKVEFINKITINNCLCPPTQLSSIFSIGYKNMCHFWSIDFLNYLSDYTYIIRIDEDCNILNIPTNLIELYNANNIMFSSAYYQGEDDPNVTIGLDKFFNIFMEKNNIKPYKNSVKCPYTNVMIVNVDYFNKNTVVQKVLKLIKETNCIFSNRWGDLPIWGYILSYLVDDKLYLKDDTISYIHGSHNKKINL